MCCFVTSLMSLIIVVVILPLSQVSVLWESLFLGCYFLSILYTVILILRVLLSGIIFLWRCLCVLGCRRLHQNSRRSPHPVSSAVQVPRQSLTGFLQHGVSWKEFPCCSYAWCRRGLCVSLGTMLPSLFLSSVSSMNKQGFHTAVWADG